MTTFDSCAEIPTQPSPSSTPRPGNECNIKVLKLESTNLPRSPSTPIINADISATPPNSPAPTVPSSPRSNTPLDMQSEWRNAFGYEEDSEKIIAREF
jgi:hypothetical protein